MKRGQYRFVIWVLLLLGMLFISRQVIAQNDSQVSDDNGLPERLAAYQSSYPVKLSDQELNELSASCSGSQIKLKAILTSTQNVSISREQIYEKTDSRLSAVRSRLSTHAIDTSDIDDVLIDYRKIVTGIDDSLNYYIQVLKDVSTMNCSNNPSLFRSALEAARAARKDVADNANQIPDFLSGKLQSSFDQIAAKLDD